MASPQVENGYIKIATELLNALIAYRIPGEQMQCFLYILRKTYGWGKKQDAISLSQFSKATGIKKQNANRAIKSLLSKKIITVIKNDYENGKVYGINKDYEVWECNQKRLPSSKRIKRVIKKDYKPSSKMSTTIDTTIDTITKDIGEKIWNEFKKHRTKIKKPLTPYAEKLIIDKLIKYKKQGLDINQIINLTIEKGWQDVKWAAERIMKNDEAYCDPDVKNFLRGMGQKAVH